MQYTMRVLVYCGFVLFFVAGAVPVEEERLSQCQISEINSNMIQMVDGPGKGLSDVDGAGEIQFEVVKNTVAGGTSSRSAFIFLNRYMKMEPRYDTPNGNQVSCDGAPSFFIARNDLVKDGSEGRCTLATSPRAVALGDDVVTDCTSIMNTTVSFGSGNYNMYEFAASSERQCCLACQGDSDCTGASYVPGTRTESYIGFGVHVPESGVRSEGDGVLDASRIEEIVTAKLGKLDHFDAWMDYSVGLWTTDLDSFMHTFDSAGVPYLATAWKAGRIQAYSVFVHVVNSQLILELISTGSTKLQNQEGLVHLEPRLPESFVQYMMKENISPDVLKEARISRATTDLDKVDEFYTEGMRIRTSHTYESEDVSVRCYEWAKTTPQVCYTKRPASKTMGSFKVEDFQNMLKDSAVKWSTNAMCLMNRWYDNHYAVTGASDAKVYNYIIDFVDGHPEIPITCDTAGLYYVLDPSGWAVQFPSGIGSVFPKRCGGGQISVAETPTTSLGDDGGYMVYCSTGECT